MTPAQGPYGTLDPVGGGDPIPLLKEHLTIGRRETCDICLPFSNVSTQHCEMILEQGYWKVRDLQSTNGIKVNGERVLEKRVYPGDELSISKHSYRLQYTPTNARSADAEVDDLHEDIMRFSLLERAGLTKHGDPTKRAARGRAELKETDLDYLGAPMAQAESGDGSKPRPAGGDGSTAADEDALEAVSPASSAYDLSDDEFLKIVDEEQRKRSDEPQRKDKARDKSSH